MRLAHKWIAVVAAVVAAAAGAVEVVAEAAVEAVEAAAVVDGATGKSLIFCLPVFGIQL